MTKQLFEELESSLIQTQVLNQKLFYIEPVKSLEDIFKEIFEEFYKLELSKIPDSEILSKTNDELLLLVKDRSETKIKPLKLGTAKHKNINNKKNKIINTQDHIMSYQKFSEKKHTTLKTSSLVYFDTPSMYEIPFSGSSHIFFHCLPKKLIGKIPEIPYWIEEKQFSHLIGYQFDF